MSSASKLFQVLVVGGLALGAQACSSDGSPGDAGAGGDTGVVMDSGCLNKPGDCSHGTCAW